MKTQGLFDPCACTSQDEYCTTELYLSVDKLKKKNEQQGRQRQGRDGVSVMYNLSHVKTERTYTPAQLQTLV